MNKFLILILFTMMKCNGTFKITQATKTMVYPGISTIKPYEKYEVKFKLEDKMMAVIDSVHIIENASIKTVTAKIGNMKTGTVVNEIVGPGEYQLIAKLQEGKYTEKQLENTAITPLKMVIYYRFNNKSKSVIVKDFKEKQFIMRSNPPRNNGRN